jgi:uncharacterized protein YfiM (DUF2279 family)
VVRYFPEGLLRRIAALTFAAALLTTAACTDQAASANRAAPAPSPVNVAPAAAAGGACQLLDWDMIKTSLGLTFSVAAAGQQGATYTCVAQGNGASRPDLMLAVTATKADASVYTATVQPKGAAAVAGIGKVGFGLTLPADADAGPGVEVGWLAGNGRIIDLRLHLEKKSTPQQAQSALPELVDLAKKVDLSSL